jgi:hypothetical protein
MLQLSLTTIRVTMTTINIMQLPDHDSTFEATNKNRENIEQYQAFEM